MSKEDKRTPRDEILSRKDVLRFDNLAQELGIGVDLVHDIVDRLQEEGYTFATNGDEFIRSTSKREGGTIYDHSTLFQGRYFKFAVAGDTHYGSKEAREDAVQDFYDVAKKEGCSVVYHPGDITDGVRVYKGQEMEVKYFGQDDQVSYAVKVHPRRKGIKTYFITGNHDLKEYERGGADPGYQIEDRRKDLEYLGPMTAKVMFPEGAIMELLHPAGGSAYALSYKPQRAINNMTSEEKPAIEVWGHYHVSFYMFYRNVHFLQSPAFKGQGLWEKRLGLNPVIGGWIVEGRVSGQGPFIDQFKPTLLTF